MELIYRLQDELLRIWEEKKPMIIFVTHDIDEALYLGQKVVIMSPNLGKLRRSCLLIFRNLLIDQGQNLVHTGVRYSVHLHWCKKKILSIRYKEKSQKRNTICY